MKKRDISKKRYRIKYGGYDHLRDDGSDTELLTHFDDTPGTVVSLNGTQNKYRDYIGITLFIGLIVFIIVMIATKQWKISGMN